MEVGSATYPASELVGGRASVLVALTALLCGCGADLPPPPAELHLTIQVAATPTINPDGAGRPSPVAVTLLQLKSVDTFQSTDFFAVTDPEGKALGEDLVAREQIILKPGETRDLPVKVDPASAYIGVAAAFRDIERAGWRAHAPLPRPPPKAKGPQDVRMTVRLDGLTVSIEAGKN